MKVCKKVKALRLRKGWTLEEAEQRGWNNWRTLQAIENGRNITLATLFRLAALYGVDARELLGP